MKKVITKIVGFLAGLTLAFTGSVKYSREKESYAWGDKKTVYVWRCNYAGNLGMYSLFDVMIMDTDYDEYWISKHSIPDNVLGQYFNPFSVTLGEKVEVKKSFLNNSTRWLHCT